MLTLTPNAAKAVRALVAKTPVDEQTGGLRIFPGEPGAQEALQLALVNGPEALDEQIDEGGAHVYVEPAVSEALDDKLLDASVTSGRVQFVVVEQPANPGMNSAPPS